jgi:DNA-binding NarL/FixJ family response regulator
MLVDDSAILLRRIADFLEQYDEPVVIGTATNGEEALAQAEELRPQVILIDLRMPVLSGLEAIPHLRAMLPEAGIIAMFLLDIDQYRQAALAAGADEFLVKKALVTDLLPAIGRVVQGGQSQGRVEKG